MKGKARVFGQDLMRGEHIVGTGGGVRKRETASLKGGLTHGITIHAYDAYGAAGRQA